MNLNQDPHSYNFDEDNLAAINSSIDELQEFGTLVHKTIGKQSKLEIYIKQVATAIAYCISRLKTGYKSDKEFDEMLSELDKPLKRLYRSISARERSYKLRDDKSLLIRLILKGIKQVITEYQIHFIGEPITFRYC